MTKKITPFLWFDGKAEQAAKFYTSVFKNSKILNVGPMSASFELDGQSFMALNGGPHFKFTPAVSFFINCKTQAEVDHYWKKLTSGGGKPGRCGWLEDKFGVSWQVVPDVLGHLIGDRDHEKSNRALAAMMEMKKLDIKKLKKAHSGK